MSMDEVKIRIRECFTNYEVTEMSISVMPDIINDIMEIIEEECAAAFTRGTQVER